MSHVVPYPPNSGLLLRAHHLLKALAAQHEVDLVAFVQEPLLASMYRNVQEGLLECRRELSAMCRSVQLLPIERLQRPFGKARTAAECLISGNGYTADWLRSAAAARLVRIQHAQTRYDVAHFDVISLARYRELLDGVPATLGHHNVESHMMARRAVQERHVLKAGYFRQEARRLARYERIMMPQFSTNLVCSDLDAARLRENVPDAHTVTIANGVDCGYFRSAGGAERPDSLIFVGTLNWYPNAAAVSFLLREIWPRLRQLRPGVTLDIVGAGASTQVVNLARRAPGVILHGFKRDIRGMLDAAAIYVCPIRDGGGTKLKILDACAMQKCIVAHPIACEGLAVQPGVEAAFAETPDEFVRTLAALLDDRGRRVAMGHAARALVERRYSFRAIGLELVRTLEEVAARRQRVAGGSGA